MRRQVAVAAGAGVPKQQIAAALGISRETLRKHLSRELTVGAAYRRMEIVSALYRAAMKGSVSAARLFLSRRPEGMQTSSSSNVDGASK